MTRGTRAIDVVWVVLVASTVASTLVGSGHGTSRSVAATVVVVVAFAKIALVGGWFMELRRAPLPLCALFYGWVVVVGATLVVVLVT